MDRYLKGVLFGGVIGSFYGLLNAPDSGKNTRLKIKTYFHDVKKSQQQVQQDLTNLQKSVTHLKTDGMQSAVEFAEEITTCMANFQKESHPQLERIKSLINHLQSDLNTETIQ